MEYIMPKMSIKHYCLMKRVHQHYLIAFPNELYLTHSTVFIDYLIVIVREVLNDQKVNLILHYW